MCVLFIVWFILSIFLDGFYSFLKKTLMICLIEMRRVGKKKNFDEKKIDSFALSFPFFLC